MRAAPLLAAAALALAGIAHAEPVPAPPAAPAPIAPTADAPRFELLDRGDAVEVIAYHIKAARTAVLPIRSHLVIPIADAPPIKRVAPTDATVKLIELDRENAVPVLSVKLGFERNDVKALSRFAQAIQVGDDLHLLVPRKLPDGDVAPRLPDPTMPPAVAARAATPVTPIAMPAPPAAHPPPAAAPVPVLPPRAEPAAATAATTPAAPHPDDAARPRSAADAFEAPAAAGAAPAAHPAPATPAGHPLTQALAPDRGDAWSQISMYAALGLAAAGAGIWLMRRRRNGRTAAPIASIDVIAQRGIGGKARIVWLRAGQREMLVSVTAQQVRMLGQWRATESAAALPAAHTHADAELPREPVRDLARDLARDLPPAPPLDKPHSPAVSGLLRLRGRTGQMAAVAPDLADAGEDAVADAAWAREILAATTGARR